MHYLISGKMIRVTESLSLPREQFVDLIRSRFVPAFQMLAEAKGLGKILAGGTPAGSRDCVMIVDLVGDSHLAVRQFLSALPVFDYYEWNVTPLETFEEWLTMIQG